VNRRDRPAEDDGVPLVGQVPDSDELIDGPRWRYRMEPTRRRRLAALTFALLVGIGAALMAIVWWALSLGISSSVTTIVVWLLPTLGVLTWVVARPSPAETDDANDDQTWPGFAIRYVLVGEDTPRPLPLRVIAATVFGAPIGWCLLLVGCISILGLV
jgi:uncharacterized membrane protein YadS